MAFHLSTLLMLYNGLRPSEACQLAIKDVKAVEGHMCLNITDVGDKQRTKQLQLFSYL
jgi:integrase